MPPYEAILSSYAWHSASRSGALPLRMLIFSGYIDHRQACVHQIRLTQRAGSDSTHLGIDVVEEIRVHEAPVALWVLFWQPNVPGTGTGV
jgi:hypothetical protein